MEMASQLAKILVTYSVQHLVVLLRFPGMPARKSPTNQWNKWSGPRKSSANNICNSEGPFFILFNETFSFRHPTNGLWWWSPTPTKKRLCLLNNMWMPKIKFGVFANHFVPCDTTTPILEYVGTLLYDFRKKKLMLSDGTPCWSITTIYI